MKVLVAGLGGIGGLITDALACGGGQVDVLARGETLSRIRDDGLKIQTSGVERTHRVHALASSELQNDYDVIFACCKSQDFPAMVQSLKPALSDGAALVAAVNGMPWWFPESIRVNARALYLDSIDPQGRAADLLADTPAIGLVVHASAHAIEPGVVRIVKADRLVFGDVNGRLSRHTAGLAKICEQGGIASPLVANVREEIWAKLWGNMNMNPLSALTRLSTSPILETPELCAMVRSMMEEFEQVGQVLGLHLPMSAQDRIEVTRVLGDFRTSMLNDALAQRRLEHEGILGSFVELAGKCGVGVPVSSIVYTLLKGLDLSFELQRARVAD